jgi:peptidoglycan/LPS O-acetylase OafA/YrhL
MDRGSERCSFLDGLRGWAALAVLFCHLFAEVFFVDRDTLAAPQFLNQILLFDGNAAVCLFFVISGFSLSIAYVRHADWSSLARVAAGRYPRLALPVLAACTLTFFLLISGLIPPPELRPEPLGDYLVFKPTVGNLLSSSLYNTFFQYSGEKTYITPLWTLPIELMGSIIIFSLLAAFGRLRYRLWLYFLALIASALWDPYYAGFVAGLIIAEWYHRAGQWTGAPPWLALGLFGVGWLVPIAFGLGHLMLTIGAMAALCAGVVWSEPLRLFFENRTSRFLGHISFPLYLTHAPVIFSFSAWLSGWLMPLSWGLRTTHLVIGVLTAPLALLVAVVFSPINDAATLLSRLFGEHMVLGARAALRRVTMRVFPAT